MKRERGAALPLAMMLVVATAALSGVLLDRDRVLRRDAATDTRGLGALHAVEGGLARARHALARDPTHAGGHAVVGAFEVTWRVERAPDGDWRVRVRTGSGGSGLDVRLEPAAGLPRIVR